MQLPVPNERAWQESDLTQDLETIAGADHQFSVARFVHDAAHDRGEARDRAASQIIAKGEPTRTNDRVEAGQRRLLVPDVLGANARNPVQRRHATLVAIRTRELDHRKFHFTTS